MKKFLSIVGGLTLLSTVSTFAHCEIPCGIYGDEERFTALVENIDTLEKSMNQISELSSGSQNYNQIVRWVNNKETHADAIRDIVSQYFLAQRIKPADTKDMKAHIKYMKHLGLLHGIIVHAMKAKQTTDQSHVEALRKHVDEFKTSYFNKKKAAPAAHDHKGHDHKGHGHHH